MERRNFLRLFFASSVFPFFMSPCGWAFGAGKDGKGGNNNQRLVIILLRGGIDGLNVVVPYGDNYYHSLRPNIAIERSGGENGVIDIDGYFGLHPALAPLMPYWQNRTLAFVHASGSPDPTRSHFDAQAYMETGTPGNKTIATGWLNRLIGELPPEHSPVQAVSIGSVLPLMCKGPNSVATVDATTAHYHSTPLDRPVISGWFSSMYMGRNDRLGQVFQDGMSARRTIEQDTTDKLTQMQREQLIAKHGAPIISNRSKFGTHIAALLTSEPSMQIVFLDFGGWDTHVTQGAGQGQLANHLRPLASGLASLAQELGRLYQQTTIIIMSEFGRTAKENGNRGTDHGHGNVMWLMGGGVEGRRIYARWPGLAPGRLHEQRDLPTTTDFRSVIASSLHNHFSVSRLALARVFPDFQPDLCPFVST